MRRPSSLGEAVRRTPQGPFPLRVRQIPALHRALALAHACQSTRWMVWTTTRRHRIRIVELIYPPATSSRIVVHVPTGCTVPTLHSIWVHKWGDDVQRSTLLLTVDTVTATTASFDRRRERATAARRHRLAAAGADDTPRETGIMGQAGVAECATRDLLA